MNRLAAAGVALVIVLALLADSSLFVVHQTEQALIVQFGDPIRVITTPGLHVKLPLMQTVISFDRRLLDYEVPPEEVILGDQRRLNVDSFTRYHITNPVQYYQTVGPTEDGIRARLNSVVSSSLRRVLGNEQLLNVLSSQRGRIMGLIRDQVNGGCAASASTSRTCASAAPTCRRRTPRPCWPG
jgi:membrane protease subunit HflC